MAKQYRALQTSFVNNKIVNEGDIVEYDGEAGSNLELIEEAAAEAPAKEAAPAKGNGGKGKGKAADAADPAPANPAPADNADPAALV